MGVVLQLIFEILMVSLVVYLVYRAWKRADLKDKAARASEVEGEFRHVIKLERTHKGLSEKSNKVNQFKKQDF